MAGETDEKNYWLQVTIELDPILEEAVVDYLVGVLGAGVEQAAEHEGDTILLNGFLDECNPDEGRRQELCASVEARCRELAELFGVPCPRISWQRVLDQDWSSNWKVHFKPFAIVPDLVIAPTWEEYHPREGERVIVMDPGMAFGTGHHGTTALSLAFVRELVASGRVRSVLDVGTGTGILAMGAALFGASRVLGVDNDPEAVRAAGENVVLNGLEKVVEVSGTPLNEIEERFDCIVANIIHDVLLTMAADFSRLLNSPGALVLSGLLHGEQEQSILRAFSSHGFHSQDRAQREEWAALRLERR